MNYLWMALAGLGSGILGAMGMGGGGILIIYLTLIAGLDQRTSQGINLLLFIPCAVAALIPYARKGLIRWKTALWFALLGLAGAALGTYLSGIIETSLLRKGFAILLAAAGLFQLFCKAPPCPAHRRAGPPPGRRPGPNSRRASCLR